MTLPDGRAPGPASWRRRPGEGEWIVTGQADVVVLAGGIVEATIHLDPPA